MAETLVSVDNVSKKFCRDLKRSLWYGVQDITTDLLGWRHEDDRRLRKHEFWAVKDVSFELKRGECLGLIGHNGAGKSTLLKMLNGLIKPDQGVIRMKGRVGALIELGAGFNPTLTGRENIFINGQILGFSRKEIVRKFDEIVDFSGIGQFIDSPVKNYSSGMKVRLGFAVAAQMEPDILLIDEVLAVGDIGFKIKCLNRIAELLRNCSVILVSHSMPQIARISSKVLLCKNGKAECYTDDVTYGIQRYYSEFEQGSRMEGGSGKILLEDIWVENGEDQVVPGEIFDLKYSEKFSIILKLRVVERVERFMVNFAFIDLDAKIVANCLSQQSDKVFDTNPGSLMTVKVTIDQCLLNQGNYSISFHVIEALEGYAKGETYLFASGVKQLRVVGGVPGFAPVQFKGLWSVYNEVPDGSRGIHV